MGLLPHSGEGPGRQGVLIGDDRVWATSDYACGDVLMFHCLTVHRALDNIEAVLSGRPAPFPAPVT